MRKKKYRLPAQNKLKRLLKQREITQAELAEMLDLTPVALHRKLHGKSFFRLGEAFLIAELLDDTIENIFKK